MRLKLRTQLIISILPLIIISSVIRQVITAVFVEKQIQNTLKYELNNTISFISTLVDHLVRTTLFDIEILGSNDSLVDLLNYHRYSLSEEENTKRKEIIEVIKKLFKQRDLYLSVKILHPSQKDPLLLVRSPILGQQKSISYLKEREKQYQVYNQETEISKPFSYIYAGGIKEPVLSIKYKVVRNGQLLGFALIDISMSNLMKDLTRAYFLRNTAVNIRDQNGFEIYSSNLDGDQKEKEKDSQSDLSEARKIESLDWIVRLQAHPKLVNLMSLPMKRILWTILGINLVILLLIIYYLSRRISEPAERIVHLLKISQKEDSFRPHFFSTLLDRSSEEFKEIAKAIDEMLEKIEKSYAERVRLTRYASKSEVAHQVAHDIRSPLAALNMSINGLAQLPEEERLLIRTATNRIQDIANSLLSVEADPVSKPATENRLSKQRVSLVLLSSLVESIITEKRVQYRNQIDINIELRPSESYYGLFSEVNERELKRVISNVVDNSVEARVGKCDIKVDLYREDSSIVLRISDNGKGIPRKILSRITSEGGTFEKKGGNGLGLRHAITTTQMWGGKLEINSSPGKGTAVLLYLKNQLPPAWFIPNIELAQDSKIIVLDDDSSVHQLWNNRLNALNLGERSPDIIHFYEAEELLKWHSESKNLDKILYLVDYELLSQKTTGLEVIKTLNIHKSSILVTSHYEDKWLLSTCMELGIKVLPKSLASVIP